MNALPLAELETAYDTLAKAIDTAGPEKSELFLVKLALLLATAVGTGRVFEDACQAALKDL